MTMCHIPPFCHPFQYIADSLVGQIYCTFSMGEPVVNCDDVTVANKWPTNFNYLL